MMLTFRREIEFNGQRIIKEATIQLDKDEPLTMETYELVTAYVNGSKGEKPEAAK